VNNLNNNKIPWEILLIALSFNSWLGWMILRHWTKHW
jgi:hypothetical protein